MTVALGRLLALVLLVLLAAPAPALGQVAAPAPALAQDRPRSVVVVGVPGLVWSDLGPDTPALLRLAGDAAVGVASVKALPEVSCAADGALTLGAGARAQAYDTACGQPPPDLAAQRERNLASRDGAVVGLLGDVVRGAGRCVTTSDGLALAAVGGGPAGPPGTCPLTVQVLPDAAAAEGVVAVLPADTTLLLVGLGEVAGDDRADLQVAMASGPGFPRGALHSASTRRAPYVQLVDVAPTVLGLLGLPVPEQVDGQPWQVDGPAPQVAELVDLERRARVGKDVTVPFFVLALVAEAALLLALRRRPRALAAAALAGAAVPAASYAAMLVPWWRSGSPLAALLALTAALAVGAAAAALRTRRPAGWVAAGTAALLAGDLVTGAWLQVDSPAGYSTLVAGRFAGIGNVALGVLAASALLGTALLAGRRPLPVVVAAGLVVVAVDGAPPWGSDVGGVLALVPAFVVLGLLLTGTRLSLVRLGLAGLGGALVVAAFALADAARPPEDRTHLGRFVGQVRDGTAGEVLRRKAEAVLGLLFHSPVTAALPLVVAAAAYAVLRPPPALDRALTRVPGLRAGLAALAVACALGFAVNDSGAAVPALALVVAVPLVVAVTAGVAAGHGERASP